MAFILSTFVLLFWISQCSCADTCHKLSSCSCSSSKGIVDLTPLASNPGHALFSDVPDAGNGWLYSYSPCFPFSEGNTTCQNVSVCQRSGEDYYSLGTQNSATFSIDSEQNLQIVYSSTTTINRTSYVTLLCDPNTEANFTAEGETHPASATYHFSLRSKYACYIPPSTSAVTYNVTSATPQNYTSTSTSPQNDTSSSASPQNGTSTSASPQNGTSTSASPQNGTSTSAPQQNGTSVSASPQSETSVSTTQQNATSTSTSQNMTTTKPSGIHPSTSCKQAGPCSCRSSKGTIDLSPLNTKTGKPRFLDVAGSEDTYLYSYNPCSPFSEGQCHNVSMCQSDFTLTASYNLGTQDSAIFVVGPDEELLIQYRATSATTNVTRTSYVKLVCDPNMEADFTAVGELYPGSSIYNFNLRSKYCCFPSVTGPPTSPPTSTSYPTAHPPSTTTTTEPPYIRTIYILLACILGILGLLLFAGIAAILYRCRSPRNSDVYNLNNIGYSNPLSDMK